MAHHLAESIETAEGADGEERRVAEDRAIDLVLKLWTHRRALPEPADPLSGYRDAIAVLGRMLPRADPWSRYRRPDGHDGLLHEMFGLMSQAVMGGLLLTRADEVRKLEDEERAALSDEETFLREMLERWSRFFTASSSPLRVKLTFADPDWARARLDAMILGEEFNDVDGNGDGTRRADGDGETSSAGGAEGDAAEDERRTRHAAVLANVEAVRNRLDDLIGRWRASEPGDQQYGYDSEDFDD